MFIYSLQTLLLAEILIEPPLNLALIQWYDFKFQTRPYMYGCPHIKLKELYNFVVYRGYTKRCAHSTPFW